MRCRVEVLLLARSVAGVYHQSFTPRLHSLLDGLGNGGQRLQPAPSVGAGVGLVQCNDTVVVPLAIARFSASPSALAMNTEGTWMLLSSPDMPPIPTEPLLKMTTAVAPACVAVHNTMAP